MDSVNSLRFRHFLFTTMFILAGCSTTTPATTPTSTSPYTHYTPPAGSNIHVEFDYPSSSLFSDENTSSSDIMVIGFGDPRFLTVPTRAPGESHGTPSDFGSVSIWIWPKETQQTLDALIKSFKEGHGNNHWITELNNYKTEIDEIDAVVLEYQIDNSELYTSTMFERNIFFAVKDQIYSINFSVAEHERGGEFEKGYEYFFNSLKIVP